MKMHFRNKLLLSLLATVLVGCGDGLTGNLGGADRDGGPGPLYPNVDPPTLGSYGRPCSVLGNNQYMLSSFSPAGDTVALAVGPGHVELHATSDGHLLAGFDAHIGPLTALAFSPKDTVLATGGAEGSVKLWRDGALIAELPLFPRPIGALVWSHDGASLVATGQDGSLVLLRRTQDGWFAAWGAEGDYPVGLMFTSTDTILLAQGNGGITRALRVADGSQLDDASITSGTTATGLSNLSLLAHSPDGSIIATQVQTTILIERVSVKGDSLSVTRLWERGFGRFAYAAFTADSKYVAIWGRDESPPMGLYDVENGNSMENLPGLTGTSPLDLTFSPDGRWAVVLDTPEAGNAARLVELATGKSMPLATQAPNTEVFWRPVRVSADGTMMATPVWIGTGGFDTAVAVWNLRTRQRVSLFPWCFTDTPGLSAQGDLLFGSECIAEPGSGWATNNGNLRIESLKDPTLSKKWQSAYANRAVTMFADGRIVAGAFDLGASDTWIWIYDRVLGKDTADFSIGARATSALLFSPDGSQLIALHAGPLLDKGTKEFSVWRVSDGQLLFEAGDHGAPANTMALSPDGGSLVVSSRDGRLPGGLDLYDAHRGTWLRTLDSQAKVAAHFSPDGSYLVAGSSGNAGIGVWRTSDWQRYEPFGLAFGTDAVFMPQDQGVLDLATGIVWCTP